MSHVSLHVFVHGTMQISVLFFKPTLQESGSTSPVVSSWGPIIDQKKLWALLFPSVKTSVGVIFFSHEVPLPVAILSMLCRFRVNVGRCK